MGLASDIPHRLDSRGLILFQRLNGTRFKLRSHPNNVDQMMSNQVAGQLRPMFSAILGENAPVRIEFWDGSSIGDDSAKSKVTLHSPDALSRILWAPGELGLARAYVAGDIDIDGDAYHALGVLTSANPAYVSVGIRTLLTTAGAGIRLGAVGKRLPPPPEEMKPTGKLHSKRRDAAVISHHYDVGNDFYRLFLGETMTYSCARFIEPDDSLDTAQQQKYDLICRKLGLASGMRLLDVGCGWGGMVLHAAQHYDVSAVGITLSQEQAALARQRVEGAGLSERIEIRVQDYRDLRAERFDAVSSIGMFEHVGRSRMAQYFQTLYEVLDDGGRLLNHAIDTPEGSMMSPNGFIARYVFPDGELQDLADSIGAMQDAGFEVRDVETLREHYAKTLRHWVTNLEANWDEAVRLVGRNRARVWWIYMVGSAVSFEANEISVHQTLGVKTSTSGESGMPLTRHSFV